MTNQLAAPELALRLQSRQVAYPEGAPDIAMSTRFEQLAAEIPSHPALEDGENTLTYGDLNAAANRLARAILRIRGEGSEPVALVFGQGPQALIGMLAVLKAGKFLLPLDPALPPRPSVENLEHSGARLIVTEEKYRVFAEALSTLDEHQFLFVEEVKSSLPADNLNLPISSKDGATLIYTSGTTGSAKGVLSNQRRYVAGAMANSRVWGFGVGDRIPWSASYSHAGTTAVLLAGLLCGTTVLPYDMTARGIDEYPQWLDANGITVAWLIPTAFRRIFSLPTTPQQFRNLRLVILGSETVTSRDVRLFREHFPSEAVLFNTLASTEIGAFCDYPIHHDTPIDGPNVPVGYPRAGVEVRVLDEHGQPVPDGEIGELVVHSAMVPDGYYRDPERTAEKFSTDPTTGLRVLRTGDLGARRPDGAILHHGRKGAQVKIRGRFVELAEVEMALLDHAGMKEALVLSREDERGDQRLIAYVVPLEPPGPRPVEIRQALLDHLQEYMIPTIYVTLDELPVGRTGKVDPKLLPDPDGAQRDASRPYVAPLGNVERHVAKIWEEVLGIAPISVEDHFTDLGGDSLSAIQVFSQIERWFGKRLPLNVMLEASTVRALARAVTHEDVAPPWPSLVALKPEGSRPPLFVMHGLGGHVLVYYQFAKLLGPEQPVYALRARGLDGVTPPFFNLQEMAAHYLSEIREVQPHGPYYVAGFSFGGRVAYEIAQQIRHAGETVALLAPVDSAAVYPEVLADRGKNRSEPVSLATRLRRMKGRIMTPVRRVLFGFDPMGNPRWTPERRVKWASRIASDRYILRPYSGSLVAFYSEDFRNYLGADPAADWQRLASQPITAIVVPGSHESILRDPDVRTLAAAFARVLEEAQAAHRQ